METIKKELNTFCKIWHKYSNSLSIDYLEFNYYKQNRNKYIF